ncbi:MAG: ABC transporter ATP-binding protein, partial [Fusobacteriaceae bacterium]
MIKIKNLNKYYINGDNSLHALKNISFSIERGEFTAIMGSSGSGKSTLMNILGALDKEFQGEYVLDGINISQSRDNELSHIRNEKIGFVFQSFNLLAKFTALENVELPLIYAGISHSERRERAEEVLKKVGLGDRMHHRPNELSGGQRQRVAVARALINNPAIILADEPTGNLDRTSEKEVLELFRALNDQGKTIIIVTHEPEIGKKCRRVIHFKDGEILSDERREG